MGRSALLATPVVPPSEEKLKAIIADLGIFDTPVLDGSYLLRSMRTKLNLTQREFGALITPTGLTPTSASVICQLETGQQQVPSILIEYASEATSAMKKYGEWLQQETGAETWSAPLKSISTGGVEAVQPYLSTCHDLPDAHAEVVRDFFEIISKRKQTGSGDRPATRGPYKKTKNSTKDKALEKPAAVKESKGAAGAVSGPVAVPLKKTVLSRGPRGPYKVKKKASAREEAEALATGAAPKLGSSSSNDGLSSPSTHSVRSSSSSNGSFDCFSSSGSVSEETDASTSDGGSSCPRSPESGFEDLSLREAISAFSFSTPRGTPLSGVDFLERLQCAEKRDQEILLSLGRELSSGRETSSSKRREVSETYRPIDSHPLTSTVIPPSTPFGSSDMDLTASLDSLTLDDFLPSLDDADVAAVSSRTGSAMNVTGEFAVEELLELVDGPSDEHFPVAMAC